MKKFDELGLAEPILRAVKDKGYDTPSPIQEQAIPAILTGRDMLAAAQTGTGKTAGFTLPLLHRLIETPAKKRGVRALILTPTRELAAQVQANIVEYSKHIDITSTVIFGGVGQRPQVAALRKGVDILVATPGRLEDLLQQGLCDLSQVKTLILDEADRMLDMGFIQPIRRVIKKIPGSRQTLLFSATFSKEIRGLTREFLSNHVTVEVAAENTAAQTVTQKAYRCDQITKGDLATYLIHENDWQQVLIFTRTKHGANRLADKLDKSGISASAIHGNKSQGARTKALDGFKQGKVRVLVATDIAARGIDITHLPHVINYELPNVPADYVHRIGRTGRAGKEGVAISLVSNDERPFHAQIEKLINQRIKLETEPGFEPKQWSDRAPTASEVLKADAKRKQENRRAQGPRRTSNKTPGSTRGEGGRSNNSGGGGGFKKDSNGPARPPRRNRRSGRA